MMAYVRSLEIGVVRCVKEDFCYGLNDCEKVEGCYRHLAEFLPLFANFYMKLAEISGENLLWFDNEINRFHVVFYDFQVSNCILGFMLYFTILRKFYDFRG